MSYSSINVERLLYLAECGGVSTQEKLADAAGVDKKTVWNVLNNGRASARVRKRLAQAVGLGDNDHELLLPPGKSPHLKASLPETASKEEVTTTILNGPAIHGHALQDIKLVLGSRELSRALLVGRKLPTFADCLRATRVATPVEDSHKDHPLHPGTTYNHFIQPSILVTLEVKEQPKVVAYRRDKKPPSPSHVHTVGVSILFGSSPLWNVVRHGQTPLDNWLDTTDKASAAKRALLEGPAPAVLQFTRYKIDLLGTKSRIVPFGIITSDQRQDSVRRVYTQFVFRVILAVADDSIDRFLKRVPTDGASLYRVKDDIDPEEVFVGKNGHANAMDVIAWRALHNRTNAFSYKPATFRRGFEIV